MLPRLLEFFGLLRANGVRVSTAETLDALRAVDVVGVEEPQALAGALEATLVKRGSDAEVFRELFDLYFFRQGDFARRALGEKGAVPLVDELMAKGLSEEEIEALLAILADEAARMSPTARMGMGMRRGHIEALIRMAGVQIDLGRLTNPLQVGFYTQQLLERLEFRRAEGEIAALRGRLERALGPERAQAIAGLLGENLGRLRQAVRRYVLDEFERRNVEFVEQFRSQVLAEKPFGQMSEEELAKLRDEVERLAKKLRQMASLRRKVERRGRLDARKTIRDSLRSGGVPFTIRRRRRRVERPRLVVLCDISDSVRNVSRFMLQFAYTLQDQFSQVRSFVFVSDLGETTDLFREHEIEGAIRLAYGGAVINVFANSNFGRAFVTFRERFSDAVTSKTTVIVIGDGRNNYHPPEAWALAELRGRARRVLWLNPEPPLSWNFGDSAMREYEPHCDRVEVVQNLASLKRVVDSLVF
jgi:uncharacterized protein with von Willebrand factor type A (vWA) domain